MAASPQQVVVDASVVIKWFVREAGTDRALSLAERASAGDIDLSVPDICFAECANVFWRLVVKQQALTQRQGELAAAQLTRLPLESVQSKNLVGTAYRVAIETGVTVYDALYVALAFACETTVITADRRMYRQLAGSNYAPLVQML